MEDKEISELKLQVARIQKQEIYVYDKAIKFHNSMIENKRKKTEKNLNIHDRALLIIRNYRHKYYYDFVQM